MTSKLRELITSQDASTRNTALDAVCHALSFEELREACQDLEAFRRGSDNLYERVRSLFFLYAIHRFHLPSRPELPREGFIPVEGFQRLLRRRFDEAIQRFLAEQMAHGPSDILCSALAAAYRGLGFQTLANQVRRSVREVRGNQWMFRIGHPADHSLRLRPELLPRGDGRPAPILRELTPVRMDLSHSAWSDIFFLGMDYPEGARVLNVSIDLGVRPKDAVPRPPVEVYLRVIDEPILRLVSVDLGASADITGLLELFDFARDYLGLLKAAVIASGIVPPGLEGSEQSLADLLTRVVGRGLGLEIISSVNNIPKGSRLAVSTNLLAALISACMRATGQARSLVGPLTEEEKRLVAARAILGEWLGGSGGGWQDSGGIWPGIKQIEGVLAGPGDPEYGVSPGRLLPRHTVLDAQNVPDVARRSLQESLILVHGGMAQNVGPILEMVTEKYLLRSAREWTARQEALAIFESLLKALHQGDIHALGAGTTRNFLNSIQTIIPAANNYYTEALIAHMRQRFDADFWGFWMLGGMSGGGMGFLVAPARKREAQNFLEDTMRNIQRELEHSLPFAIEPVVYDFAINSHGTQATLLEGSEAILPPAYYALQAPGWLRLDPRQLTPLRSRELGRFGEACRSNPALAGLAGTLFDRLFPPARQEEGMNRLESLLRENGFDAEQHERIRSDLKRGLIGLVQNRLPVSSVIEDVRDEDVVDTCNGAGASYQRIGEELLARGEVAVVTLAAGAGSRWTQGAGVVKALHPFCAFAGRHRTFLEMHLAKSRRVSQACGTPLPHIITTSYLTHRPVQDHLETRKCYGYSGPVLLSRGLAVGLRLVPMVRDLRFAWEETPHQLLDEQAQKVRESLQTALAAWAVRSGEGSDYTDNVSLQCLHPVGHWYEVANLFRNGILQELLAARPILRYLMLHNIDTLGAEVQAGLLGLHAASGHPLTFEVISRRIDDRGGGLARVNGRVRLVEGSAIPHEEDELALHYYNTLTTWIDVDKLLAIFGLNRVDLSDGAKVSACIRRLAARVPTYITLKEVKKRWGNGQEDVFPVCQFEKLWGDMTALPEVDSGFFVVPRLRGQQLKEPGQLDSWLRDGSAEYVESLCLWE
jgi:hypothetical protein